MEFPKGYKPSRTRGINGCWNCEHCFEEFDLFCFKTIKAAPVFESEERNLSYLVMAYVGDFDYCDEWKTKTN